MPAAIADRGKKRGLLSPILRLALFIVALLVLIPSSAFLVMSIAVYLFGASRPPGGDAASFYFSVVAPVVAIVVTLIFRRWIDRRTIASLGFAFDQRWWSLLLAGGVLAALLATPGLFWDQLHGIKSEGSTLMANPQAIGVATNASWVAVAILVGSTIFQNVAIRGYLLQNVWEQWGRIPAVILAALTQVLMAGPGVPSSIYEAAMAVYLAVSVFWSGSLWFAMGFLPVWNVLTAANPNTADVGIEIGCIVLAGLLTYLAHRRGLLVGREIEDYQRPAT